MDSGRKGQSSQEQLRRKKRLMRQACLSVLSCSVKGRFLEECQTVGDLQRTVKLRKCVELAAVVVSLLAVVVSSPASAAVSSSATAPSHAHPLEHQRQRGHCGEVAINNWLSSALGCANRRRK